MAARYTQLLAAGLTLNGMRQDTDTEVFPTPPTLGEDVTQPLISGFGFSGGKKLRPTTLAFKYLTLLKCSLCNNFQGLFSGTPSGMGWGSGRGVAPQNEACHL